MWKSINKHNITFYLVIAALDNALRFEGKAWEKPPANAVMFQLFNLQYLALQIFV